MRTEFMPPIECHGLPARVAGATPQKLPVLGRRSALPQPPHAGRRGSAYLLTLGTAMIVSILALAALATIRVGRLHVDETRHSIQAQLNANAALEIALHRIENNPTWRNDLATSAWDVSTPLDVGTFRISGTDPTDSNLLDDDYDPVELEVAGASGPANHRLGVQLRTQIRGVRSLETALHAGADLNFNSATVSSDGILSTNASFHGSLGTVVTADLEAADVIDPNGAVLLGTSTTTGRWPRALPDTSSVYDYYLSNGTTINAADLPLMGQNLLPNPGMENGTTGWLANVDATLESETDPTKVLTGTRSIRVKNRGSAAHGIRADVGGMLENGAPYKVEAWIYTKTGETDQFRIGITAYHSGGSPNTVTTALFASQPGGWIKITGNLTPTWSGGLSSARLFVESNNDKKDFFIDDFLFRKNDDESNARLIENRIISPASNPFGSNVVNAQGVYVVQCAGERIVIRNSRIVGTLVLIDPEGGSRIEGTMNWVPAVYGDNPAVPNMPALLVNSDFSILCTGSNLSEPTTQVNFNPTGTPYGGVSDTDKADNYPCLIRGVVYAQGDLTIGSSSKFEGSVLGQGAVNVSGSSLNFKYDATYLEQNPPPGFRQPPDFQITPRSITRVVD